MLGTLQLQVNKIQDGRDHIIEIVGHTTGDSSNGFQPTTVLQFRLQVMLFGDVFEKQGVYMALNLEARGECKMQWRHSCPVEGNSYVLLASQSLRR